MSHETENRYHVQGKMNGRGRRWKNYFFSNDKNVALDKRDSSAGFVEDSEPGWKWRVWDTLVGQEVTGRFYDYNDILAMQSEQNKVVLELQERDTAYHPGSTKHVLHGPLKVTYWIYPTGWHAETEDLK